MTLRLALVISGDAAGAKRAVEETAGAVEDLGRKAEAANKKIAPGSSIDWGPAADNLKKISDEAPAAAGALAEVGQAGRDAAPEIDAAGVAAGGAAPKFANLKSMAAGALAGFAIGLGGAAIGAGLAAAGQAAGEFFDRIVSNRQQIEETLSSHQELVRRIKGAYNEADGAASSYGLNSTSLLRFQSQQNVSRIEGTLADETAGLADRGALAPIMQDRSGGRDRLGPLREEVNAFRQDLRDGQADVIAFRQEIAAIAEALPAESPFRGLAEVTLADTEEAAKLQAELERAKDLLKGLQGDAEAAATALGGSAEKYQALGEASGAAAAPLDTAAGGIRASGDAAAAANPALAETERLLRAIANQPSPARAAATPPTAQRGFAAGGYTGDAPTDQVAGFVHGREYVFDAASTAAIGVGNLEAIRRGVSGYAAGGYVGSGGSGGATGAAAGGGYGDLFKDAIDGLISELMSAAKEADFSDFWGMLARAGLGFVESALKQWGDDLIGQIETSGAGGRNAGGMFGGILKWFGGLFGGGFKDGKGGGLGDLLGYSAPALQPAGAPAMQPARIGSGAGRGEGASLQARPQVILQSTVHNYADVEVSRREEDDGAGGVREEILIEKRVAGSFSRPGSAAKKALAERGVEAPRPRR